jgi:hypothetical protein
VRRNALVIVQVAVCTLVMVGMGLCQRNLYNMRNDDFGFSARNLVALNVYTEAEDTSKRKRRSFTTSCGGPWRLYRECRRSL